MSTDKPTNTDSTIKAKLYPETIKITESPTQTMLGKVTAIVENKGTESVDITGVTVTLPMGLKATDLAIPGSEKNMSPTTGLEDIWEYSYADVTGQFDGTIKQGKGTKYTLTPDNSIGFTLSKIPLNKIKGDAFIEVDVFGPGDVPIISERLKIIKVVDRAPSIFLQASLLNVDPKEAVILSFKGDTMDKFTLTSSTDKDPEVFNEPGHVTRNPEKSTTYTVVGRGKDVEMQAQVSVGVYVPELNHFRIINDKLDQGEYAILNWDGKHAEEVILKCSDEKSILQPSYPLVAAGDAIKVGPITKNTVITGYAKGKVADSEPVERHATIKAARVISFEIAALPLRPNEPCTFKLNWEIKNASRFEIVEINAKGEHKLNDIPNHATEWLVFPKYAETTYKLYVFDTGNAKKNELINDLTN